MDAAFCAAVHHVLYVHIDVQECVYVCVCLHTISPYGTTNGKKQRWNREIKQKKVNRKYYVHFIVFTFSLNRILIFLAILSFMFFLILFLCMCACFFLIFFFSFSSEGKTRTAIKSSNVLISYLPWLLPVFLGSLLLISRYHFELENWKNNTQNQ